MTRGSARPTAELAKMQAAIEPVTASILVAVRNEESFIAETVASMQAQRFEESLEFLVIDGRSADRTRRILAELAENDRRIRILDNPKRTLAAGLNVGLRAARGEFIVQMEGHTFYPPSYVARGVARLRQGDVDWVSGRPAPYGIDPWSRRVALALRSRLGTGGSRKWANAEVIADSPRSEPAGEVELDTGVFGGAWRRATLEAHGGWDERWTVNRDSELAARILAKGGRIVCLPELTARYVPRSSLRALARQYLRYGFFRAKTASSHPRTLRQRHLLPPTLVLSVPTALAGHGVTRAAARTALAAYALALAATSARAWRTERTDALFLPPIFLVMHASWGAGYIAGLGRFGIGAAATVRRLWRGCLSGSVDRTN